jgi:hypothetical protein
MHFGRSTRITIETERTLIIRRTRSARAWCTECRSDVNFVLVQEVHHFLPAQWQELSVIQNTNKLHLSEQKDGSVLICLESLLRFV